MQAISAYTTRATVAPRTGLVASIRTGLKKMQRRTSSINADGWPVAFLYGLSIYTVWFLLSGAVLLIFGEI